MDDSQLISTIRRLTDDAVRYRDQQSQDRADAVDYYNGDMTRILPVPKGHSTMVSKDVRAAISKVMPSITRTLLSTPKVFAFEPKGPEDEAAADQATDYVNEVVFPRACGERAVKAAIHDAALLRNGILKVHWQKKKRVQYSKHTGLDEMALAMLVADDDVEVIEQEVSEPEMGMGEMPEPPMYSVKIKRTIEDGQLCIDPVPAERFLIDENAIELDEAMIVGTVERLKQSDLIAMGYDKETVLNLPTMDESEDVLTQSRDDRVDAGDNLSRETYSNPALRDVDYYELYIRIDRDGDGLSELLRCCFGGKVAENTLLSIEEWDEHPFVDFTIEDVPHQWQGVSIADDVMDMQKLKTSLWRETLNNIYWQNKPQPILQDGAIEDLDAVMNPVFGKPITIAAGRSVKDALGYTQVPFVAKNAFDMMAFVDDVIQDRTGISEASSGMAPDALQNMTAKASAMIEAAGIGRTEAMVRCVARGMKRLGKRILKLIIQHQDKEDVVRLRNEWVAYDPRSWNADMDVSVNTGLGAGSRERDLMMLQMIAVQQEKLLAQLGPINNPFVSPENLYNTLEKTTEAAGFPSAEPFFTRPDPQIIAQKVAEQQNRPDPEQMKLQAQMQLEQAKMQTAQAKEKAQMDADLMVKRAEMEAESVALREKLQADALTNEQKLQVDRERLAQERELFMMKLKQDFDLATLKQREAEQRMQADQIGRELDRMAGASQN